MQEQIYAPKPKSKYVYRAPFDENDKGFKVHVYPENGFDYPEHCGHYNKARHIIPYPEALTTYIFPLVQSAGLGKDGLSFEREYIVSSKKHGLLYRGFYNALMLLGDMPTRSWSCNYLSFGAHYRIKDSNGREIFHAKMIYNEEIEFEVTYYFSTALKYRYRWRCWEDNSFVYDLDYDAMDAVTDIFNVLECAKTYYHPSSSYFDVVSYMQHPREFRPRGSFLIPLSPGSNGVASRNVRRVLNRMNYLCMAYEIDNQKQK